MAEIAVEFTLEGNAIRIKSSGLAIARYYAAGIMCEYSTNYYETSTGSYLLFATGYTDGDSFREDLRNLNYSKILGGIFINPLPNMLNGILVYNYNGFHIVNISDEPLTVTVNDNFIGGLSSISVTADSGINSVLYNRVTYDTFPATIPLDPAATTMQVESKTPVLTINDGGNLKSVTYGSATYTKFPATVTATTPEFALTARGKDSPVITVRTDRTQTPVITNT